DAGDGLIDQGADGVEGLGETVHGFGGQRRLATPGRAEHLLELVRHDFDRLDAQHARGTLDAVRGAEDLLERAAVFRRCFQSQEAGLKQLQVLLTFGPEEGPQFFVLDHPLQPPSWSAAFPTLADGATPSTASGSGVMVPRPPPGPRA